MKLIIFILLFIGLFSGCSTATKTRQLGEQISNIQHPLALGVGILLYKVGKATENDKEKRMKQ